MRTFELDLAIQEMRKWRLLEWFHPEYPMPYHRARLNWVRYALKVRAEARKK